MRDVGAAGKDEFGLRKEKKDEDDSLLALSWCAGVPVLPEVGLRVNRVIEWCVYKRSFERLQHGGGESTTPTSCRPLS